MLFGFRDGDDPLIDSDGIVFLTRIFEPGHDSLILSDPGKDASDFFRGGDDRRIIRKLIAEVDIKRMVITSELPAGGDIDFFERKFFRMDFLGKIGRIGVECEIPVAVQAKYFFRTITLFKKGDGIRLRTAGIGDEVGTGLHFINGNDVKIMVVCLIEFVFHQGSPFVILSLTDPYSCPGKRTVWYLLYAGIITYFEELDNAVSL